MIPQRNLSLLSNRLARKGGRRVPEAILERDYCLSSQMASIPEFSQVYRAVQRKLRQAGLLKQRKI